MGWSAFTPLGRTLTISVTTTASTALQAPSGHGNPATNNYLVSNATTQGAFFVFGANSTALAVAGVAGTTTPGTWIGGLTERAFTCGPGSWFSAITPLGTTTLYITPGDGL